MAEQELRRSMLSLLGQMDGAEVGTVTDMRWLLKQMGVEWNEGSGVLHVLRPEWAAKDKPEIAVVRLASRRSMQRLAKKHGATVILADDGETFATLAQVVRAVLAVTVGDPVQGASTPAVWKQQHAERMKFLREVETKNATA